MVDKFIDNVEIPHNEATLEKYTSCENVIDLDTYEFSANPEGIRTFALDFLEQGGREQVTPKAFNKALKLMFGRTDALTTTGGKLIEMPHSSAINQSINVPSYAVVKQGELAVNPMLKLSKEEPEFLAKVFVYACSAIETNSDTLRDLGERVLEKTLGIDKSTKNADMDNSRKVLFRVAVDAGEFDSFLDDFKTV